MRNHDEKTKDMAESVLPSTAAKRARAERRRIHKAQRARQRVELAELGTGENEDFAPDFREGRRLSATEWMVWDRRAADKIGPLTRWAVAIVNADPDLRGAGLRVQVEHFARLLPDNLIGRHAVQHIEWALRYQATRDEWTDRRAREARQRCESRARVARQARRILESGYHDALNSALRHHYRGGAMFDDSRAAPPAAARYLLGTHDIEAFASSVVSDGGVRALIAGLAAEIG